MSSKFSTNKYEENQPEFSWQSLLRLVGTLIKPYRRRFIVVTILRLAGDIAWLYPAVAMASIVNFFQSYQLGQSIGPVWIIIMLWTSASVIRYGGITLAKYWGFQLSERVSLDAQLMTMRHMFALDISWHEKENSGNKLKRIQRGGESLDRLIRIWIGNVIEITVNFFGVLVVVATFDLIVASILGFFLVSFYVISFFLTRRAVAATKIVNVKEEVVNGLLFEVINNIRSVKVMSMITSLYGYLQKEVEDLFIKIRKRIAAFQLRSGFLNFWAQIFRLGGIIFIIYGISQGRYELGLLILFYSYFASIWTAVSELTDISQDIIVAKYAISRMSRILDEPIGIDNDQGKKKFPVQWQSLTFQNVSFGYGDHIVLRDVSFSLKRGEKVGIVGSSGAGKSTLFKLLLKEHEGFQGAITFDNQPIQKIKKSDYFNYLSVVLQDTEVFNFSLSDNIVISNSSHQKDKKLLKQSMKIAHVDDFIDKLPQGVDTIIGEKGVKLSGGEKQRLGIARAIFKQPQILLLDEATSHLDLESEEKIRDSLHQFFQKVTALVIAHRLTTIKEMDRILVLEEGKIVEQGSFEELILAKGRFYQLWEKQKL